MKNKKAATAAPNVTIDMRRKERRLAVMRSQLPYWVMLLIPLTFFLLIRYWPMYGLSIAFQNYKIGDPFISPESRWAFTKWFKMLFKNPNFVRLVRNTLVLNSLIILISFPIAVGFALLLNEVRNAKFKKVVQTISYMPHFMSTVVIVSLITTLCDPTNGAINLIIKALGGKPIFFIMEKNWFRPLYLISGMWQGLGWGTIIYLAAISNVDPGLYEAARLDGAGRWRQMWNITIPSIAPTVSTMLIMQCGKILGASMEKVLLMQQPATYETSQVLSTYVYQVGITNGNYSFAQAINLFTSLVNLALILSANWLSKKLTDSGIF